MQLRRLKPTRDRLRVVLLATLSIALVLMILSYHFPFPEGQWDFLSIGMSQRASANPDWLTSNYTYRMEGNVTGSTAGQQTNYPKWLTIYKSFPSYGVDFSSTSFSKYGSNPILEQGTAETWDEYGIRENQLLVDKYGNIELEDDKYTLFYSGKNDDGDTAIGRATFTRSSDKTTISDMTKYGSNPILDLADMGWDDPQGAMGGACVIKLASDSYVMYFWGRASGDDNEVYYATSSNGLDWVANTTAIVSIESHGLTIVCARELQYGENAGRKVMFFEVDATSIYRYYSDEGWTTGWTDGGSNPVFEGTDVSWATKTANPMFTELADGHYVLGFNGYTGASEPMWQGGFAYSTDLDNWTDSGAIRLPCGSTGQWDDGRVETMVLVKDDIGSGLVGLFYFGIPTTDNVQDGAIGYATIDQAHIACLRGHCQDDFDDIRFTQADGTTKLYYWPDTGTLMSGISEQVWINFNTIADGNGSPSYTNFYLYYGDDDGVPDPTYCSGADTFTIFDDFERGSNGDPIGGDWNIIQGDADVSNETAFGGTRSGKIIDGDPVAAIDIAKAAGTDYAIRFRLYKEDDADFYATHGNGVERLVVRIESDENIDYYNGSYLDTGADLTPDQWELMEFADINHSTPKFDIWLNDVKIKDNADMYNNSGSSGKVQFNQAVASSGGDFYIDDFLVRKWCDPEPTWGAWGDEETFTAEITNTPGSNDFGVLATSATANTAIDYFTITNTGNTNVDVTIYGTDLTGGDDTWTLSDTATPGENIYGLKAGIQSISNSTKYPTTATTESVSPEEDQDWDNPTNIYADDGSYASITAAQFKNNQITYRLKAQTFGFNITDGATITGIKVEVERYCDAGETKDYRVQLLDGDGNLVGDNKANTVDAWDGTPTIATYGNSTTTWNATPTAAMVNDADFGVVLSAESTTATAADCYVDFIRVTIYYEVGDFTVIVKKNSPYNTLVSDLVEDATQDWGLKIYMPTSLSGYDSNEMSATITLVASEAA